MIGLTRQMQQLHEFIAAHFRQHSIAPSFEEMQGALGLSSKSGVHRLITALEERGIIRRMAGRARAMELIVWPTVGRSIGDQTVRILLDHHGRFINCTAPQGSEIKILKLAKPDAPKEQLFEAEA